MTAREPANDLSWDVPADRAVLQRQICPMRCRLVVMEQIHKMPGWKTWLEGVAHGRPAWQALLVTGSARRDTLLQLPTTGACPVAGPTELGLQGARRDRGGGPVTTRTANLLSNPARGPCRHPMPRHHPHAAAHVVVVASMHEPGL